MVESYCGFAVFKYSFSPVKQIIMLYERQYDGTINNLILLAAFRIMPVIWTTIHQYDSGSALEGVDEYG
jgi:hypothetical protein